MTTLSELAAQLQQFSEKFDTLREDMALNSRGRFCQIFPISRIKDMTVDEYVIGHGTESFCSSVEVKTKAWANINGANASKFGIYFGRTKADPERKYHFNIKFGKNKTSAFASVKKALLKLVADAKRKDFEAIDESSLSQMFKAKIISLYFPDLYVNICGADRIIHIASELGLDEGKYTSEYQHLILEIKQKNRITKGWSNPKFMLFLMEVYFPDNATSEDAGPATPKRPRAKRKVNFEDINENRKKFGKLSENYARQWEKDRLIGLGQSSLAKRIEDRTDMPAYGYDFLSFSSEGRERYIEVKSVGKNQKDGSYRFFLSENERTVSKETDKEDAYYFYLVFYDKEQKPYDLRPMLARDFYMKCDIAPCAYVLRFDI